MRAVEAGALDVGPRLRSVEAVLARVGQAAPAELRRPVADALLPGKRLRPRVVLLAHDAAGGDPASPAPVEAAAAVEVLHAATLVLDDAFDGSALRRGAPTVVARHGLKAAMLTSGWLAAQGFRLAAPSAPEPLDPADAAQPAVQAFEAMVAAEARAGAGAVADAAAWTDLALGKTAGLFALAAELGARRAGCFERGPALRMYGTHLGVAFQAGDDLLDVLGDAARTGKPVGLDRRCGAPNLAHLVGVPAARALAGEHAGTALAALDALPPGPARDALADLARTAAARDA